MPGKRALLPAPDRTAPRTAATLLRSAFSTSVSAPWQGRLQLFDGRGAPLAQFLAYLQAGQAVALLFGERHGGCAFSRGGEELALRIVTFFETLSPSCVRLAGQQEIREP